MPDEIPAATAAAATQTPAAAPAAPIAAAVVKPAAAPAKITLNQFAIETSKRDKRVALLHGFVFEETLARRLKDTEAAYTARFREFETKPV